MERPWDSSEPTVHFILCSMKHLKVYSEYIQEKICRDVEKPQITESIFTSLGAYLMVELFV